MSAAIGVGQLECLEEKISRRRSIFDRYVKELANIDQLKFMPEPEGYRSTRWLSCAVYDGQDTKAYLTRLYSLCEQAEIEIRPLWKPMHMQPVFAGSTFVGTGVCEKLFEIGVCLPSGSGMTESEQSRVIEVIQQAVDS